MSTIRLHTNRRINLSQSRGATTPRCAWKMAVKFPCKPHVIAHGLRMKTITATSARSDLYRVIDSAVSDHEPIHITGKRGNAVLVGEADWRAIQETLFLVSNPGMRDSIRHGMVEPIANCSREIDL